MRYLLSVLLSLVFFSPSFAATETNLNAVWYDTNFKSVPLKKILVIGMTDNLEKRRNFESTFVEMVTKAGGKAEASLDVLPKGKPENKETVKEAIKGKGFDSVLVCHLVTVDLDTAYVPGAQAQRPNAPSNPYSGSFGDEYQRTYNTVYTPGYLKDSKKVVMQSRIYSAKGDMIWTGESETFDPLSMRDLIGSMGMAMRKDLLDKGFLKPR